MTTENEFKEALAVFDDDLDGMPDYYASVRQTIRRALLIADALMGEPSINMLNAGIVASYTEMGVRYCAADSFKAMRDQMLAELDKGE